MTTQNNAAQHVLTDTELMALLPGAVRLPQGWKDTARAIESALLSKLRAPVAGEAIGHVSRDSAVAHMRINLPEGSELYAASQASPIAWEAVANSKERFVTFQSLVRALQDAGVRVSGSAVKGWDVKLPECAAPQSSAMNFADAYEGAREDMHVWKRRALEAERELRDEREKSSRLVAVLNVENGPMHMGKPAPHARAEPVRIVFPSHVRKMWSGGEIQAWLDEHQGVNAPKPGAKGSLERYRKWQAEQAEACNAALEDAAQLMDQTLRSSGAALIRALKTQADKDGGQQHAGDMPSDDALAQIGYAAAIDEAKWGETWADLEPDGDTQQEWRAGAKAIRAALAAARNMKVGQRDTADWAAIAAEAQVERDVARDERDVLRRQLDGQQAEAPAKVNIKTTAFPDTSGREIS